MSAFVCADCGNYRDADDGCDDADDGLFGLICVDCMEERAAAEEAKDRRLDNPLEPGHRRLDR